MIAELFMAGAAGIFNFLHRRLQAAGLVGLHLAGDHQFTGGRLKIAGQLLELRLFLPHIIFGTGVVFFAHAREMLPRLMGQRIQFDRTLGELGAVKWDTPAQHPAQVFTSLEHLLEDRLALAQGELGSTPPQADTARQASNTTVNFFNIIMASRSRETAASILAPPAKTNSPINNKGCPNAVKHGQSFQELLA